MISDGFEYGWKYAHQYTDYPSKESVKQAVFDHIINELDEWFIFEENEDV